MYMQCIQHHETWCGIIRLQVQHSYVCKHYMMTKELLNINLL